MKQMKRVPLIILLGFLAALAPLSTDMYLPALPVMDAEFGMGTSVIQMTLTTTMVGMALGQLFVGPISDRYGRRLPLMAGMAFFACSTFGCMVSENIWYFLLFRFIQGMSGSFGIVVARAIARDVYTGAELTRFVSLLMLVNGLAPILAPIIGGQIIAFAEWRWIFAVLALIGFVLMFSSMRLAETLPPEMRIKTIASGFRLYGKLLHDGYFFGHCIIQCTIFAAFFAYISGSPFLFQNIYHVSPQVFSLIFGGLGFAMILAGLIPVRLAGRVSDIKMMTWAVIQALVGSLLFMCCVIFSLHIGFTVCSLAIIVSTTPLFGATSFSLSMRNHGKEAGAASALFGFSSMFASGIVAPLVGIGGGETALPMAIIILAGETLTLLCFLKMVYFVHRRGYRLSSANAGQK